MKPLIYTFIFIIILSACSLFQEKTLKDEMMSCYGKTISFPSSCVYTSYVDDTVSIKSNVNYRIVLYIDSNGCVGCRMNLNGWKRYANYIDSLTKGQVETTIFIHPHKYRDATFPIYRAKYKKPICIDMKDDFGNANREILSHGFNAFLIDENNKVILVGNPTSNNQVGNLYTKTIAQKLGISYTATQSSNGPINIDLGAFNWREIQLTSYTLHNKNEATLVIDTIYSSCDCTIAKTDKQVIEKGDSTSITISYKAEEPNSFLREVFVECSNYKQYIIRIEGVATE